MRAKVCYTLSPKLYHKCKPTATNRSAFPRRPRASRRYRRCTQSDRSHYSSRVQGELRSALRHTLDPAAPTTRDRDSVHRLPTLAEAHSARDDEDSAPPPPPTSNSRRNVSSAARKHEALTGGSLPFEAVIARNTIPASRLVCDRPFSMTQAGGCADNAYGVARAVRENEVASPSAPLSSLGDVPSLMKCGTKSRPHAANGSGCGSPSKKRCAGKSAAAVRGLHLPKAAIARRPVVRRHELMRNVHYTRWIRALDRSRRRTNRQ